jgi:hypothetical protein
MTSSSAPPKSADQVEGGAGDDVISGGAGNDTLRGQAGADTIFGDAGNDTLEGGEGDDTLEGGDDVDVIIGGNHTPGGGDTARNGETLIGIEVVALQMMPPMLTTAFTLDGGTGNGSTTAASSVRSPLGDASRETTSRVAPFGESMGSRTSDARRSAPLIDWASESAGITDISAAPLASLAQDWEILDEGAGTAAGRR